MRLRRLNQGRHVDFRPLERTTQCVLQRRESLLCRPHGIQYLQFRERARDTRGDQLGAVVAARLESSLRLRVDTLGGVVNRPTRVRDPLQRQMPLPDRLIDLLVRSSDSGLQVRPRAQRPKKEEIA